MQLSQPLQKLIRHLTRLPGVGPRSARRLVLALLGQRTQLLLPLIDLLHHVEASVHACTCCGNLDVEQPCQICQDPRRDPSVLCVVEHVCDLWALERTHAFRGRYHVLGGTLSAFEGIGPEQLNIARLLPRLAPASANLTPLNPSQEGAFSPQASASPQHVGFENAPVREVVLALNLTTAGQQTAHYLHTLLRPYGVHISMLAHGVPLGGELDHLDEGTLSKALTGRYTFQNKENCA